ncbi:MAG: efflux RND transporter periplasmic adaptor subunit [Maritimibacter sp.]|nr:efflux RND transporter periplasmic adaptor subunit [Maritimibacter sp.]
MKHAILFFAATLVAVSLGATPLGAQPMGAPGAAGQAEAPAALTVTVAPPEVASWPVGVQASGWLAAWQEVAISAEVGGQKIVAINADVGDSVKAGDVLVQLSRETLENDLAQLQASVDVAQAALDEATADADRARKLDGSGSVSQQQLSAAVITERKARADLASAEARLASAQIDLDRTRITAMSDGVISARNAALGDVVMQGTELFRLIRDGRIEWRAEVPLFQLRDIAVGMKVTIPAPAGDVHGTVRQIAPNASEANGRVIVYVDLAVPEGGPEPKTGLMVSGRFEVGEREAVTVPSSAIVMKDGYSYIFALDAAEPKKVTRVRVETGRRRGDRVEIIGDFAREAQVVQAGGAFLSEGSTVRVVATGEGAAQGTEGAAQ